MSDLHFGAETSLLTKMLPTLEPEYQFPSETLQKLLPCLRSLLALQPSTPRPTLVLAGDVLELALSETNQAVMAFETFLAAAFPGGPGGDLFAREIMYVPGNHDHHAWEMARETQFLDYVSKLESDAKVGEEWHVTRLYPKENESSPQETADYPEQRLLTALARRNRKLEGVRFVTAYPNWGVRSSDGKRSVIFTHGHYVEPLYTLMSELQAMLFPTQPRADDIAELERENFAWIDFFWSTMGRSGAVGKNVQRIYEMGGTVPGRAVLIESLVAGLVSRFGRNNWTPDFIEKAALSKAFNFLSDRAFATEREDGTQALRGDTRAGLLRYIGGPLLRQIAHECRHGAPPEEVAVVFGHTHKPFAEALTIDGYAAPVQVFNTGGWVVDSVERKAMHGGAIVFVDENCDCASLRIYNEQTQDAEGDVATPVQVSALRSSPLADSLKAHVAEHASEWAELNRALNNGIRLRAKALALRSDRNQPDSSPWR